MQSLPVKTPRVICTFFQKGANKGAMNLLEGGWKEVGFASCRKIASSKTPLNTPIVMIILPF